MRYIRKTVAVIIAILVIIGVIPQTVMMAIPQKAHLLYDTISSFNILKTHAIAGYQDNQYKLVLTWGASPSDLDSHMIGQLSDGSNFHCSFSNRTVKENGKTIVELDRDDTSSYGPETITFYLPDNSRQFTYYIYNYSGTGTITDSKANIKLYKDNKLIGSYDAPTENQPGRYWTLFRIIDGQFFLVNTVGSSISSSDGSLELANENIQYLNGMPHLSENDACNFLSFLFNKDLSNENLSNDTYFKLITGKLSTSITADELRGLIMAFTLILQKTLNSQISTSSYQNTIFCDLLISNLERELGDQNPVSEIVSEVSGPVINKLNKYLISGLVDMGSSIVSDISGIIFTENHFYSAENILKGIKSFKAIPSKVETFYNRVAMGINGVCFIFAQEKVGRYSYFSSYLNNHSTLDGEALQFANDAAFIMESNNTWASRISDLFTWFTGKDSWQNHRDDIERWANFCYQISEYAKQSEHHYENEIVQPSCTAQGYTHRWCTSCEYELYYNYTEPTGHDFKLNQKTKSTCTTRGCCEEVCSRCGDVKRTYTDARGHNAVSSKIVEPTCTQNGYTMLYCSCGYSWAENETLALEHSYTYITVQPTEITQGYDKGVCSKCGDVVYKNITSATGHHFDIEVRSPTCEADGYTVYTCTDCEYNYRDNITPRKGHQFILKSTISSSCSQEGQDIFICQLCGAERTDTYDKLSHDYSYSTIQKDASCEEEGYIKHKCQCGEEKTQTISAIGHSWKLDSCIEADCIDDGYEKYRCTICGKEKTNVIPTSFGTHDYICVEERSGQCTQIGYKKFMCSRCDSGYFEQTSQYSDHMFGDWTLSGSNEKHQIFQYTRTCRTCEFTETETRFGETAIYLVAEDEWIVPNAQTKISVMDTQGNVIDLNMSGLTLRSSLGYIDENNCLHADVTCGNAKIDLLCGDLVIVSTVVHIIIPERIQFLNTWNQMYYNSQYTLTVQGEYQDHLFEMNAHSLQFTLSDESAGQIEGMQFTACDSKIGISSVSITANILNHPEIKANYDMQYKNINFDKDEYTLILGEKWIPTIQCTPDNGMFYYSFSISKNNSSLTIDDVTGEILPEHVGKAEVTLTTLEGYSISCKITVVSFEGAEYSEFDTTRINDNTELAITGYIGSDEIVNIPEKLSGLPVVQINSDIIPSNVSVKKVNIPATVKNISSSAFRYNKSIEDFSVDEASDYYCSVDGVLYSKDKMKLVRYPGAKVSNTCNISDDTIEILDYSFYACNQIKDVVIPDAVSTIGYRAFYECENLAQITLGAGLTRINDNAFSYCNNLTTVNYNCTNCTYAGDYSIFSPNRYSIFGYCSKLSNFNIGNNVTQFPNNLFNSCSSIKNITIPQSVTYIGNRAFYRCTGLENVYYEGTLDNWCGIVFKNSYSNPCYYADNLYCDGKLVSGDVTIATDVNNYALYNSASITNVTLTDNVKKIGNGAFQKCTSLKNVTIPDSVTYIGNYAFSDDSNIESFSLPKSLTTIGDGAFQNCALIDDIVVPENVTNIGASAFYGCNNLQRITLPFVGTSESATGSDSVFGRIFGSTSSSTSGTTKQSYDSSNSSYYYIPSTLKSVTITNATKIPYGAFDNCSMITDLSIPKSVASVGENAFRGCTGLKKLSIPFVGSSRTSTGYSSTFGYPFGYSSSSVDGYTSQYYESSKCYYYNIPSSIEDVEITDQSTIPYGAFYNCSKIKNIRLNNVITDISINAFFGLSGMENVYFDGSIEEWCNINCTSYRPNYFANHLYINGELLQGELVIPSTITNVPSYAFAGATDISSIKFSSSLSSVGADAFTMCTGLSKVDFDGTLDDWVDIRFTNYASNPVYFAHDLYIGGVKLSGKIVLPEKLNVVPNSVFAGCNGITEVILNDNITSIEQSAFDHCTNLAVINIPETVTKICEYAFDGCSGLAEVTIPNGVTNVPRYAFRNCTSLKKLTVSSECTYGRKSFSGCENIESITLTCKNGIMPNFGTSISSKSFRNTPWYISDAINEITIEDGVKRIGDNAFRGTHASKINVPTSVKEIGSNAFYNCSKLGEITIPAGTNSIGTSAFSNNTTIKCYKNSPAYLYAVENSLIYELLDVIFEKDSGNIRIDNAAKNVYGFVDGLSSLINDTTVSDGYTMSYDAAERVFTGMKIQIKDSSSNVVEEYSAVLFGDVNGDGWYDGRDAVTVSMIANGMLTREQVGEAVWMAADCNHDGKIDQADVDLLNQAGLLLSSVDQTKSTEELLETSSEYNEYLNLIDQSVGVKSDEPKQESPETQKPSLLEFLLTTIWNYIKLILSLFK